MSSALRITFVNQSNRSQQTLYMWERPWVGKDPLLELKRKAKTKLKLRLKVKHVFLENGEELGHVSAQELLSSSVPSVTLFCSVGEGTLTPSNAYDTNKEEEDVWVKADDAVLQWELRQCFSSEEIIDIITSFEPAPSPLSSPFTSSSFSPLLAEEDRYCDENCCSENGVLSCKRCAAVLCSGCSTLHECAFVNANGENGDCCGSGHVSGGGSDGGSRAGSAISGSNSGSNSTKKVFTPAQQKKDATAKRAALKAALTGKSAEERGAKTQDLYAMLLECAGTEPPPGLQVTDLATHVPYLLSQALAEVNSVFSLFLSRVRSTETTNVHFNLTTNDFTRNTTSPWPVLPWRDARIPALRRCLELVLAVFKGQGDLAGPCLNAIVRRYRPGDLIGFHADRKDYTDEIFGLVLENVSPQHGLIFYKDGKDPFFVHEPAGTAYCFRGPARWDYLHGYHAPEGTTEQSIRTSVSFRFFSDLKYAPPYDSANDV